MSTASLPGGGVSAGPRLAPVINRRVVGLAGLVLLAGVLLLSGVIDARQAALYALGAALGMVLYHAAFGFTSAWRVFIADGRGAGLRAQMVMLAVAVLLFFPALAAGTLFGQPVSGTSRRSASRCWSAPSSSASACSSGAAAPRARSIPSAAAPPAWS